MKYILTPIFFIIILLIKIFCLILEIIWKFKIKEPINNFKKSVKSDMRYILGYKK